MYVQTNIIKSILGFDVYMFRKIYADLEFVREKKEFEILVALNNIHPLEKKMKTLTCC